VCNISCYIDNILTKKVSVNKRQHGKDEVRCCNGTEFNRTLNRA
jgi:hypothetical protein